MGPFIFVAMISKKPLCKGHKAGKKHQFFTLFLDSARPSLYNSPEGGECFEERSVLVLCCLKGVFS
jgi:hypothetical protein